MTPATTDEVERVARQHEMPGDPPGLGTIALQWYVSFDFAHPHTVRESNVAVESFKDGYRACYAALASTPAIEPNSEADHEFSRNVVRRLRTMEAERAPSSELPKTYEGGSKPTPVIDEVERDSAQKAYDYYQASTCACMAAERYVHDCPKHGHAAALSPAKGDEA